LILEQSNHYAVNKNPQHNLFSIDKLKVFLELCFCQVYAQLPDCRLYWEQSRDIRNDLVHESMGRNRFDNMVGNIHFANNDLLNTADKLAKVWPLIDKLQSNF